MEPRILVPYDFSPAADHALEWAVAHRRAIGGGGAVRVVHVLNPVSPLAATLPVPPLVSDDLIADLGRRLREKVAPLGEAASSELILAPAYADAIVDEARRWRADLIVMGTHGRTGISRLVLGSVAEVVLRHAPCPVVAVHAPASTDPRGGHA